MTEPQPVMAQAEQDQLTRRVGRSLLTVAGEGWQRVRAEYRSAGRHIEVDVYVTGPDGAEHPVRPPQEVVEGLGRLRQGMYRPGRGTWLSGVYLLEPPSSFSAEFEPDVEPRWRRVPPPIGFADELKFFPRADENIPDWLRRRAGLPPLQPAEETSGPQGPSGGQPQAGQPQTGQPQTGHSQAGQPQTGQPQHGGHPQAGQPQAGQPQPGGQPPQSPSGGQPQAGQPQTGQPQTGQPQTGQPQPGQPQPGQPQAGQPQPGVQPQAGGQPTPPPGFPFGGQPQAAAPGAEPPFGRQPAHATGEPTPPRGTFGNQPQAAGPGGAGGEPHDAGQSAPGRPFGGQSQAAPVTPPPGIPAGPFGGQKANPGGEPTPPPGIPASQFGGQPQTTPEPTPLPGTPAGPFGSQPHQSGEPTPPPGLPFGGQAPGRAVPGGASTPPPEFNRPTPAGAPGAPFGQQPGSDGSESWFGGQIAEAEGKPAPRRYGVPATPFPPDEQRR